MSWPSPSSAPAATRPPATPVIIASPTPAPTPVMHSVRAGETLIGIAVRYGVSLEALQAANPAVRAEFLSVGAQLVIPVTEHGLPAAVAGLPTPTAVPLQLGPPACYPQPSAVVYCFVQIRNSGPVPVAYVSVRLTLAGADGLPIASQDVPAAVDRIPAGGFAPAGAIFAGLPDIPPAVGAELLSAIPVSTGEAGAPVWPLEVLNPSGGRAGTRVWLSGQLRNPAVISAGSAVLTLALLGSAGEVLGYRQAVLAGLGPGETRPFSLTAVSLGGPVHYHSLTAEGRP